MTNGSFWGNAGISASRWLEEGRDLRERCFGGIWWLLVHYSWNPSTIASLHGEQSQESTTRAVIGVEKPSRIPGGRFAMLHLVLLDKKISIFAAEHTNSSSIPKELWVPRVF